jgi:hypothetical protein
MTSPDSRSARRRTVVGTGLVVVLAAVLIAIVVVRSSGEKVLGGNGDTLVLVGKDTGETDGVGLQGTLVDVFGCLGVVSSKGTTPVVVVWPHGTTIKTPDPLRITAGGSTYGLGDSVELGGRPAHFDELGYFEDKVPSGCRGSGVFVAEAA